MPIPISPEVTQGPLLSRIDRALSRLPKLVYRPLCDLAVDAWISPEPAPFAERERGTHQTLQIGDTWGKLWDCAWLHFTGAVPAEAAGEQIVLLLDLNGEGLVVDADGNPVQGLTGVRSGFDYSLGRPGKRVLPFAGPAAGGETVDVWVDAVKN